MKKSNGIIAFVFALALAFLLWLWFSLGLNHIDKPLDLVLSIGWWVVIIVALAIILKTEHTRRMRIRTIYVDERSVFNSEMGVLPYAATYQLVAVMNRILNDLTYEFSEEDTPEREQFVPKLLVKTHKHDVVAWTGSVILVDTKQSYEFKTKEELRALLDGIKNKRDARELITAREQSSQY